MMMNGVVFKNVGEVKTNDVYAINTVAYHFLKHPIPVTVNQPIRIYLASMGRVRSGYRISDGEYHVQSFSHGNKPATF